MRRVLKQVEIIGLEDPAAIFILLFSQRCNHLHSHPVFRSERILRILRPVPSIQKNPVREILEKDKETQLSAGVVIITKSVGLVAQSTQVTLAF